MESGSSLSHTQVSDNCLYPKPAQSSPYPTSHFLKIHRNITSHLRLGFPSSLFPSCFPTKTLYTSLPSPIRATYPAHLSLLDFITRTIVGEQYKSLSSSLWNFYHSPVTSFLLGPNILVNSIFSNTLILRFFDNVSDQVSHPYKTTDNIIALYILIFKCLDCIL
jgi:hypothetical protein